MDFKSILNSKIEKVNNALKKYIPCDDNPQKIIYEAMSYSVFAGGKRLRPIIMMMVCELFGTDENVCIPFAAAMEMIHTYSLIHDALPAMDNDDLRRGMPTNHVKFGEANAILAGDALLNRAFEVVSEYSQAGVGNDRVLKAISVMAKSSGCNGMIGGQVVDIECEGRNIDIDELRYIHSLKTGAIIRSSAVIGAILGGADDDSIGKIDEFARNLGIAFQIRDDVLDVVGDAEKLGKPIGSDAENDKNTYVKLLGIEKSEELVDEYSSKAVAILESFGEKAGTLIMLTKYLLDRNS